ncbi:MAG: Uma2 family endonuclease [Planctomycetaceae bacterium]
MSRLAPPSALGEPAWEMATRFPNQGNWSEEEYLHVFANRGVELVDGRIEVLPAPTEEHQDILVFLFQALSKFVNERRLGKVQLAGLRVRVKEGKFREPDVVFMLTEHAGRREKKYWRGADLAMEIVSEDDPDRDLKTKRDEYADAGIAEYWIVDPRTKTIAVLTLPEGEDVYAESGVYEEGSVAESALLEGFRVDVTAAFTVD